MYIVHSGVASRLPACKKRGTGYGYEANTGGVHTPYGRPGSSAHVDLCTCVVH